MDSALIIAVVLAILIFVIALLYSNAGHAGASGYIAGLTLMGTAATVIKPTALILNIIVATVGTVRFYRAGLFSWRTLWPFAVISIPMAYLGGTLAIPLPLYKSVVGIVLLCSAAPLFWSGDSIDRKKTLRVPIWIALIIGAALGLLSGVSGVGGGIFLSQILLLTGWATTKEIPGVSAPFILSNSIAGLLGNDPPINYLPDDLIFWAPAALLGAWIGTELESRALPLEIRRIPSLLLFIGAAKLLVESIPFLMGR